MSLTQLGQCPLRPRAPSTKLVSKLLQIIKYSQCSLRKYKSTAKCAQVKHCMVLVKQESNLSKFASSHRMFPRITSMAWRYARVPDPALGCCLKNSSTWFEEEKKLITASLLPRPSHHPVFDCWQYTKMGGGLGFNFIMWMTSMSTCVGKQRKKGGQKLTSGWEPLLSVYLGRHWCDKWPSLPCWLHILETRLDYW